MAENSVAPAFRLNPPPVSPLSPSPQQPILPSSWQATAILHPFSPPPTDAQDPSPFYELCIANVSYAQDNFLSVQLLGASGRMWWYIVTPFQTMPDIPAFSFGNGGLQLFVWNSNFGMSPMMTPVNASSNPLPTQVLYHWTADPLYAELPDRAQRTTMSYAFNSSAPTDPQTDTALMFGSAPATMPNPPALAGHWFDYTVDNAGTMTCAMDPGGIVGPGRASARRADHDRRGAGGAAAGGAGLRARPAAGRYSSRLRLR
ncbi:MAG TPA: hypothetical protein VGW57_08015 [Chthoniobacterales bacterium]|nr:hypothetical protein [Chthoniobacterales bacterium]